MENLKKLGAIGGAISLALCWPLAVGQIGQSLVEDGVANMNNDMVKGEIVEYDRGYLSSVVLTRYSVTDPVIKQQLELDGLPVVFNVRSDVTHGLTSLSADSVILENQALPLTMQTTTQLNGNTAFDIELDSWQFQHEQQGLLVSTSPAVLSGNVTVLGDLQYAVDIPSVQVDFDSGEEIYLSALKGEGKGKQANGYWLGQQNFTLEKFNIVDAEHQPIFLVESASYDGNTTLDVTGDKLNSQLVMNALKLHLSDGTDVDRFKLDFSVSDVDSHSFDQIMAIYQNTPALGEDDIAKLLPHIDALFSKGFDVSVNELSLAFGDGKFSNQWQLAVPQGTDGITSGPMKLISAINGNLNTYFSDELVEAYPFIQEGIDELLIMELIEKTDDGYQLKAQISDGKLKFENGHEFPLVSLLLPALAQ
ncbi:DUF945 family protein [Vibrio sp. CAU 1672]|uniref:DUF945 family protein n=1 Tax=Vibrio sp. CAU 1672 TaxID=3032594 RepID=UPI0023DB7C5F|nr:DUF945 family protein [Vibrio sp. CAU 1672]MDF2152379.1 DUF945 family protein [Vibrio sp. CAU 1672]